VQVGQVPVLLGQIEAVPHEELVRHGEADVANGKVVDEPPVGAVEERHRCERGRIAEPEGLAEVVERQPGVDHVLDDEDVAPRDLLVEVLEEADPGVAAGVGVGAVRGQLDEVEGVGDADRPGEVRDEDEARLQRGYEERLASGVVLRNLAAELADAATDLLAREVDLADLVTDGYDASSRRYRSARRSTSRL
jgi:hypothetical protein